MSPGRRSETGTLSTGVELVAAHPRQRDPGAVERVEHQAGAVEADRLSGEPNASGMPVLGPRPLPPPHTYCTPTCDIARSITRRTAALPRGPPTVRRRPAGQRRRRGRPAPAPRAPAAIRRCHSSKRCALRAQPRVGGLGGVELPLHAGPLRGHRGELLGLRPRGRLGGGDRVVGGRLGRLGLRLAPRAPPRAPPARRSRRWPCRPGPAPARPGPAAGCGRSGR